MIDLRDKFQDAVAAVTYTAAAAAAAMAALLFACIALFVWTREQYGTVTASLVLAVVFLVLALAALIAATLRRRRLNQRQAQKGNVAPWWTDPIVMTTGLELFRLLGTKRLMALLLGGAVVGTLLSRPSAGQRVDTEKQ
jgi:heme/copper-type cytochrome/quinol oxidase subunit 2